ncbi:hypothetical protein B0J13DRAFT_430718 [Dactylonectria estremocensis]|uniref:SGNH hydrolase-type esterase domain-containing protein n=1 Tax=Dactylonectria estremocensis TaxID=1079267 RepID=A0A9P9FHN5_9HYPO|nr:hypothetical protein B0J13DRAFT_430718 [Dactylonectria estremocensis]
MALGALSQRHNVSRRWNGWTLMTLMLVASSFWIPASNAATLPRRDLQPRAIIADGIDLRILPIGDSITHGSPDEPWRSYRGYLWDMLIETNNVDYVGAEKSGTGMVDQDHEGHRGQFITKIRTNSSTGIYAAPNIALLHAGTNDMKEDEDILNAPSRIKILVDYILEHSEDAVVLVAQIIPSTYNGVQAKIDNFNDALVDIVDSLVSENKKVALVAMNEAVSTSDLQDGLHPTEEGYEKMADAWYAAIQAADAKGWITEAGEAQDPPDSTDSSESCQSTPSWYDLGTIAKGPSAAYSNGEFVQNWVKIGVVAEGACDRSLLHFMDLDGDGLKDYACVNKKNGSTRVHLNIADSNGKTSGLWNELGMIATGGSGRKGAGVRFADLNGDGRDDYIWVDSRNGAVYAWINRGANDDGSWAWQALGVVASGVGANTTNLQLADINGDGRADFCIVDPTTGTVTAWINNGASYKPDWYKVGVIATGASASQGDTVFLGDFTGEGRADYMIVGEGGKVTGLVNRRQETTLIPGWMTAVTVAEGPDGVEQEQVRLVDMTGDGKVDYLAVGKEGKVTLWENTGTGGTYQPGDGVVLCDLNGDKAMDYFWLSPSGKGWVYLNTGKGTDAWKSYGQTAAGVGYDREFIRMGVLTKSGRADYIVLDEDTGRALWWQNLGEDYKYNWAERGECATGPKNTIETKFGWKFNAKNVRFADLNNDGLDDYLYINETGAVVMWAHQGGDEPSFANPTLVADGVGALPQDIHFADTNGDGRLDYVVVGRATGLSRSWHHLGFRDDGSIRWNTPLSFADGTGAVGSAVMIVDMTGEGRADYVTVEPGTGRLNLTKNRCLAIDSDDDNTGGNKPWLGRTESEWCDIANQTGLSPAQKSYVWGSDGAGLGVGQWLDEKIASDGDKDWLKTIRDSYKDVLGGQYLKNLDCTSLEGDCNFLLLPNCSTWDTASEQSLISSANLAL